MCAVQVKLQWQHDKQRLTGELSADHEQLGQSRHQLEQALQNAASLTSKVDSLTEQLVRSDSAKTEYHEQVVQLKHKIAEHAQSIADLTTALADKERGLSDLQQQQENSTQELQAKLVDVKTELQKRDEVSMINMAIHSKQAHKSAGMVLHAAIKCVQHKGSSVCCTIVCLSSLEAVIKV